MITTIRFQPSNTGRVLRNIRRHNGQSQEDVARLMELSSISAVSHYENGQRALKLETLTGFADALGYDVEIRLIRRKE